MRLDLTKEQRDAHIRRYAELLASQRQLSDKVANNSAPVGRPKAIATEVAEATGLSARTVRRALKPEPAAPVQPKPVRSDAEVILSQATKRGDDRLSPEPKLRC